MRTCPKCGKWSLTYDPMRKRARCLYMTECGYSEYVGDRDAFVARHEGLSSEGMSRPRASTTASQAAGARKR